MTTITQKRKKSIWVWVLLILIFAAIIALTICHLLGIIDLSFIATGFLGIYMWASVDVVNALIVTVGWVTLGILGYWILLKYFIGQKVTTNTPTYQPQGQTINQQPQTDSETVIS